MTFDELIKYGGYGAALIIGALMYFFPVRRKELDEATAKLIKTLQETVGALERDLNLYKEKTIALETHQKENIQKIAAIDAERQLLKDFIAGRDKETKEFQIKALALHEQNSQKITELVTMLGQHFLNIEKSQLNK